jgi:uncharacterized membrane protein
MIERDRSIDIARGLAVFLMIQGNVGGVAYRGPMTPGLDAYAMVASFVPAMFITAAGAVVAYTARSKGYGIGHYLARMAALLVAGAVVVDMVAWRAVPFVGMDVLYLIGVSLPIAYVFSRLGGAIRWSAVVAVFLVTPFVQSRLGYSPNVFEMPLFSSPPSPFPYRMIVGQWFVDGWFPVFPWVGFALLGVNLGKLRWGERGFRSFASPAGAGAGLALVAAGAALWLLYDGPLYARAGFPEKIYPPTLAYLVTACGEIVLLLALFDWKPTARVYDPLLACSESALFVYILHHVFLGVPPTVDTSAGLWTVLGTSLVVVFAVAYALRALRRRWPRRPAFVRYVLGV